jgi:hypothetical protein
LAAWLLRQVGDEEQSDNLLEQALELATTADHTVSLTGKLNPCTALIPIPSGRAAV